MATVTKQSFTDEFKEGVIQYLLEHPEEKITEVAKKFGVADSTLHVWKKKYTQNNGSINSRGINRVACACLKWRAPHLRHYGEYRKMVSHAMKRRILGPLSFKCSP